MRIWITASPLPLMLELPLVADVADVVAVGLVVVSTSPAANAHQVERAASIHITFSGEIDLNSFSVPEPFSYKYFNLYRCLMNKLFDLYQVKSFRNK